MVSLRGQIINFALTRTAYKNNMQKAIAADYRRRGYPTDKMRNRYSITDSTFLGRDVYTLHPPKGGSTEARILLYFHGGAYFYDIMKEHFAGLSKLCTVSGTTIIAPSYPLAPDASAADIRDFGVAMFNHIRTKHPTAKIIMGGDSAGAGLAVQVAQYQRDMGDLGATALILWSPWVDVSMTNPDVMAADRNSVMIGLDGIAMATALYIGGRDPKDPLCSPIYGDLLGLPPMHIWAGGRDLLYPDIIKFADLAKAAGVEVRLTQAKGQNHMWMFLPQPEAKVVMRQTATAIRGA